MLFYRLCIHLKRTSKRTSKKTTKRTSQSRIRRRLFLFSVLSEPYLYPHCDEIALTLGLTSWRVENASTYVLENLSGG